MLSEYVHILLNEADFITRGDVASEEAICCLLLSVLSRRRDLQKPDLIEVLSALLRGEAQIVVGVLELAYYRSAGDGQAFPTRERHRVLD